jgi:hypothetical protein
MISVCQLRDAHLVKFLIALHMGTAPYVLCMHSGRFLKYLEGILGIDKKQTSKPTWYNCRSSGTAKS